MVSRTAEYSLLPPTQVVLKCESWSPPGLPSVSQGRFLRPESCLPVRCCGPDPRR